MGIEPISPERQSGRLASNPNKPFLSTEHPAILEGLEPPTFGLTTHRSTH
jgi:hypothetical protein